MAQSFFLTHINNGRVYTCEAVTEYVCKRRAYTLIYSLFTGVPYTREKVMYMHPKRNVCAQICAGIIWCRFKKKKKLNLHHEVLEAQHSTANPDTELSIIRTSNTWINLIHIVSGLHKCVNENVFLYEFRFPHTKAWRLVRKYKNSLLEICRNKVVFSEYQ